MLTTPTFCSWVTCSSSRLVVASMLVCSWLLQHYIIQTNQLFGYWKFRFRSSTHRLYHSRVMSLEKQPISLFGIWTMNNELECAYTAASIQYPCTSNRMNARVRKIIMIWSVQDWVHCTPALEWTKPCLQVAYSGKCTLHNNLLRGVLPWLFTSPIFQPLPFSRLKIASK